jgi:RNA-directed DNA polymerase
MRRESHVRFCEGGGVRLLSATRLVIAFERQDDAERVADALHKRMGRYGLTLHPEKTRLFAFVPPRGGNSGKGSASFDLLGFTLYWRRTHRGNWAMWCKTRRARVSRAIKAAADWCRRHRHRPVKEQHAALVRRVQGHINYFGVNGNIQCLHEVVQGVRKTWRKWLNRRSQRARMTWERFHNIEKRFPLPRPRIVVDIWGR